MMIEKLELTKRFIASLLDKYQKPVIFCSFGKDSLVLVHIIKSMVDNVVPVIFYREPFQPEKYDYANRIIRQWNLSVYDYPPLGVGFFTKNGIAHTINYHQVKGVKNVARMTGLVPPEKGEEFLCTRDDLIERPRGNFCFPWDLCFHGHKSSDVDPVNGAIPLKVDLLHVEDSSDIAYPLKDWTDADIWEYIESNNLPINYGRYLKRFDGTWTDVKSKALNSDYFAACWKCVDRSEAASVCCPKTNKEVPNVGHLVHYDELKLDYIGKQS
jgi:3'-phosphoadenosine 5'-phosphosulfate sulfotransferase (PAPS reductase)/FAD synthetase